MGTQIARIAHKTVQLTNAQIKALPTTGITLIPAPGRGKTLHFLFGHLVVDRAGGAAYTNVTDGVHLDLLMGSTSVASSVLQKSSESRTQVADVLAGNTIAVMVSSVPPSTVLGGPAALTVPTSVRNTALTLKAVGNTGDFTGGHADSTMTVTVYYAVLLKPVQDLVVAPAAALVAYGGQTSGIGATFRVTPASGSVGVSGSAPTRVVA